MSFRLVKPDTIVLKATLRPPGGSAGKLSVRVRYLAMTERRALQERLVSDKSMTDADLIRELLVGWSGLADEQGQEIPYSGETAEELIDIPYFHDAVRDAIVDHLVGDREKNSTTPGADGSQDTLQ